MNWVANVGIQPCCPDSNMVVVENSCESQSILPPKCTCTGTVVRCSHQQLTEIPKYIPLVTTELYLDVNEISKIPYDIGLLTNLKRLILSYNNLQCISETSFFSMQNLRILALGGNPLFCDCKLKWLSD
ncbi:Slit 1 protein [Bulinus truncatus]|nr:Slit 1 protein [Bulinus truncatus]